MVVGLDCETSTASLRDGGRLIQARLAVASTSGVETLCALVAWPSLSWDPASEQVHGISRDSLEGAAGADQVDELCRQWLLAHGADEDTPNVLTVGFNVGSFDHPFFSHALPRTMELVTHRTLELNSVLLSLDGLAPRGGEPRSWQEWKRHAKAHAAGWLESVGVVGREHDAGYDAALALGVAHWLRTQMRAGLA